MNKFTPEQMELFKVILYCNEREVMASYLADSMSGHECFQSEADQFEKDAAAYSNIMCRAIEELTGESLDTINIYEVAKQIDSVALEKEG